MKPLAAMFLIASVSLSGCNRTDNRQAIEPGTESGINLAAMDKSVSPGDDFFSYANGTWFKNTEIPAERASIGATYTADKERERRTKEMLAEILKGNGAADTDDGKIAK